MSQPSETPAPSSPSEGSAGRRPRSKAQQGWDAHRSNRLAKANRLAAELRARARDKRETQDVSTLRLELEQASPGYRFEVARAAGVNLNYSVSDATWRFCVGQAVQSLGPRKRRTRVG